MQASKKPPSFVAIAEFGNGTTQELPNRIRTFDQFSLPIQAEAAAIEHIVKVYPDEDPPLEKDPEIIGFRFRLIG